MVASTEHRCRQMFAASHFFPVGIVLILTSETRSGCFFLKNFLLQGS
jgi:hypothetical protein